MVSPVHDSAPREVSPRAPVAYTKYIAWVNLNLAMCLYAAGEVDRCIAEAEDIIFQCRNLFGPHTPQSFFAHIVLANAMMRRGDVDEYDRLVDSAMYIRDQDENWALRDGSDGRMVWAAESTAPLPDSLRTKTYSRAAPD